MRILLVLGLILAPWIALADEGAQRYTPGMSLNLQGQVLDLNAPICLPAAGSYSVAYRNSIATGCTTRASDDFATLVFSGSSPATYTMPQSAVTTFTGSISGTTLSTPSNAVTIGSVITGLGVLDNTYVTAGSGTSWTVNNSQTVGSETLTQSIFPPGHGACFTNNGTAPLTLTATTSAIYGAAGVVNGNPAATGGPVVLFPGGEGCLQADPSNKYKVSGFIPGSWFQSASPTSSVSLFQWTGLAGYPRLHLSCSGLGSVTTSGTLYSQLAYGGVFQTTGYTYNFIYFKTGTTAAGFGSSANATAIQLTGGLSTNVNDAASIEVDFEFAFGTGTSFSNDIKAFTRSVDQGIGEQGAVVTGSGPLTTTQPVTGIKLFVDAGTAFGMCWLTPRT